LYKSNGQTAYIRLPFIAALFIDPGQIKAPQPEGHTQRERRCGSIYISIAYIPIFSCQQIRHSTGRTGAEQQCSWQATMPLDSRYAFVFCLYSDVVTHPAAQSMQAFNWVTRKSVER